MSGHRDHIGLVAILDEVVEETRRQDDRWGWPKDEAFLKGWSASDDALLALEAIGRRDQEMGIHTSGAILAEELGEAWRETDPAKRRAELVQAAAVIVSIIQALDEEGAGC